ncbi:recombinase XerC [Corynebacterium appendicis]|uniref:recombinase XerC n=1 Tax=Corynebacterium appendicis TaxID=163202 RepID=UPI002353059B|nr:recombinase XerC [Corynebacterium appendicis]
MGYFSGSILGYFSKSADNDEIIEQSVRSDSKTPRASMGTMRRHLKNIANELNPDFDGPRMYHRYERSDPNPPYTDKEVHDIWQWAQVKNNGKRTQMKQLIVACGLGAGLTAAEAGHLTYGDIEIDELGVQLHLPGRTVPVLAEWDEVFRDCQLEPNISGEFLIYPRSTRRSDIVSRSLKTIGPLSGLRPPNMRRMRTTWIVNHLANHVPDVAICEAAGIKSLGDYERYRPETPSVGKYRSLLHRPPVVERGGLVVVR